MATKDENDRQPPDSSPEDRKVIASEDLFQGRQEVVIFHEGVEYRLRKTRLGKLILNK